MNQEEDKCHIEILNEDELLHIFQYLSGSDLKSCSATCSIWDAVIGRSAQTMKKLPLMLKEKWEEKEAEISNLKRKFHTIFMYNTTISSSKSTTKMLKDLGAHAQFLQMDDVTVKHKSFHSILNNMKELKKLRILDSTVSETEAKKMKPTSIASLKSLVMIKSDSSFLKLLSKVQVQEFKYLTTDRSSDCKLLKNFLVHQAGLETLAISSSTGDVFKALQSEEDFKFRLNRLAIEYKFWGDDPQTDDAFMDFLKKQRDSLEVLETKRNLGLKVLECIMKELKLKTLVIDASLLPTERRVYQGIRQNKHLTTLRILDIRNLVVAEKLLHIYPSIERLVIDSWSEEIVNEVLIFIANNLRKIRQLEIPFLVANPPETPIPTLKNLYLNTLNNGERFQAFCVAHTSIEKLSFSWIDDLNWETLNHVTLSLRGLQHVVFGHNFTLSRRMMEIMRNNCPNLRRIDIFSPEENSAAQFTDFKSPIVYNFSNDTVDSVYTKMPSIWAEEEKDFIDLELYNLDNDDGDDISDDDDVIDGGDDMDYDDYDDYGYALGGYMPMYGGIGMYVFPR